MCKNNIENIDCLQAFDKCFDFLTYANIQWFNFKRNSKFWRPTFSSFKVLEIGFSETLCIPLNVRDFAYKNNLLRGIFLYFLFFRVYIIFDTSGLLFTRIMYLKIMSLCFFFFRSQTVRENKHNIHFHAFP